MVSIRIQAEEPFKFHYNVPAPWLGQPSRSIVRAVGEALRADPTENALTESTEAKTGRQAIRPLLLTGLRRMEGLALKHEGIGAQARCARLEDTKSGAQMRALSRAALAHFASIKPKNAKSGDFVFPGSSKGPSCRLAENLGPHRREREAQGRHAAWPLPLVRQRPDRIGIFRPYYWSASWSCHKRHDRSLSHCIQTRHSSRQPTGSAWLWPWRLTAGGRKRS